MQKQKTEEQFGTCFLSNGAVEKLCPGVSFIRELETPYGRPDAVLFDTRPNQRWSIMAAILESPSTSAFAKIFFTLKSSSRRLTAHELSLRTGMSLAYVRSTLRSLLLQDWVSVRHEHYTLSRKARIPETTIISIEFKLHDWKKALQQAVRHLAFADTAYVIMPTNKRSLLLEHRDIFKDFGVSIAVFDTDTNNLEVLLKVEHQERSEVPYLDLVGRIWTNHTLIGHV